MIDAMLDLEEPNFRKRNPLLVPLDQPADYKNRGDLDSDVGVRKACRFSRALLGPCSGLEDTEFGFKEGKPCLIVKLNRIVNYRPRVTLAFFCLLGDQSSAMLSRKLLKPSSGRRSYGLANSSSFFSLLPLMRVFLRRLNPRCSPT